MRIHKCIIIAFLLFGNLQCYGQDGIYNFHYNCHQIHCISEALLNEGIDSLYMELSSLGRGYVVSYRYALDTMVFSVEPVFEEWAKPPYIVDTMMINKHIIELFKKADNLFVKKNQSIYLSRTKTDSMLYEDYPLLMVTVYRRNGVVERPAKVYFSTDISKPYPKQEGDMLVEYSDIFRDMVTSMFRIASYILKGEEY